MRRHLSVLGVVLLSASLFSCGGSDAATRTVQIDYPHDEFAAAFNAYFPKRVSVHPGDTIRFVNAWSGEPHNVLLGRIVDDLFEYSPIFEQYDSEDAARAGGVSGEVINKVNAAFARIPPMTQQGYKVYQPGAKPCYIARVADVPPYTDGSSGEASDVAATRCSAANSKQPAFTGRQALYNSGLIPFNGDNADVYELPIADDATPGTYNYFCTYHWIDMSGQVTIAPETKDIPSNSAVLAAARREVRAMEKPLAEQVKKANDGDYGDHRPPVAGLPLPGDDYASVNEFYPRELKVTAGEPVTWAVLGATHTISFNVPSYFPVFRVADSGNIVNDKRVDKPVGWDVPAPAQVPDDQPQPTREVDVGEWNGAKTFRSSGLLFDGDSFTVTFTKPGNYPYACLLHPAMIGTVKVSA